VQKQETRQIDRQPRLCFESGLLVRILLVKSSKRMNDSKSLWKMGRPSQEWKQFSEIKMAEKLTNDACVGETKANRNH
jgi:hypothetical protein